MSLITIQHNKITAGDISEYQYRNRSGHFLESGVICLFYFSFKPQGFQIELLGKIIRSEKG